MTITYGTVRSPAAIMLWILQAALLTTAVLDPSLLWAPIGSAVVGLGIAIDVTAGAGAREELAELTDTRLGRRRARRLRRRRGRHSRDPARRRPPAQRVGC